MCNNITLERAKGKALERVHQHRRLIEIYKLEQERLEQVVDLALMVENPANHWQEYERLKVMAAQFVGFEAQCSELATCQHYEVMLDFIDWLLPNNADQKKLGYREEF